jgi:hypothetical protein
MYAFIVLCRCSDKWRNIVTVNDWKGSHQDVEERNKHDEFYLRFLYNSINQGRSLIVTNNPVLEPNTPVLEPNTPEIKQSFFVDYLVICFHRLI